MNHQAPPTRLMRLQERFKSLTPRTIGYFRSYMSAGQLRPRHKWLHKLSICGMFDSEQLEHLHQLKDSGVISALYVMDRVDGCAYARFIPDTESVKELCWYIKHHHFRPARQQVIAHHFANCF